MAFTGLVDAFSFEGTVVGEPLWGRFRRLPAAKMACGFSPVQHCFVADCGHWFFLLIFVTLRQTVEECVRLRFQSEKAQTPQDSRDPQMIVISRRKPDCRLGRKIRSASDRDLLA